MNGEREAPGTTVHEHIAGHGRDTAVTNGDEVRVALDALAVGDHEGIAFDVIGDVAIGGGFPALDGTGERADGGLRVTCGHRVVSFGWLVDGAG